MDKFSKADEMRLDKVMERTCTLVEDGMDPSEALAKAANERSLPAGHLPLAVNLYNIGRTELQYQQADSVLDRAASFPIADLTKVAELAFPEKPETPADQLRKSAISNEYAAPPNVVLASLRTPVQVKQAAAKPVVKAAPPATPPALPRKLAALKGQVVDARIRFNHGVSKFAKALLTVDAPPPQAVLENSELLFGKNGKAIVELVFKHQPVKSGSTHLGSSLHATTDISPYRELAEALGCAEKWADLTSQLEQAEKQAADQSREYRQKLWDENSSSNLGIGAGPVPDWYPSRSGPPTAVLEPKQAGLGLGLLAGVAGTEMGHGMAQKLPGGKPTAKLQESFLNKLTDPAHESMLLTMRAQALLTNLLANDEVIRGYPVADVTRHYNELSQSAPRLSELEAPVRTLLRKRLQQGAWDPYEMDSVLKMEGNLHKMDQPPTSTGE
jgi:hypothetical protein